MKTFLTTKILGLLCLIFALFFVASISFAGYYYFVSKDLATKAETLSYENTILNSQITELTAQIEKPVPYIDVYKLEEDLKEYFSGGDYKELREKRFPGIKIAISGLKLKTNGQVVVLSVDYHFIDKNGIDLSAIPGYSGGSLVYGTVLENGTIGLDQHTGKLPKALTYTN